MSPLQQRDLFEQAQSVYFTRQWKLDTPPTHVQLPVSLLPSLPCRENDFYFISVFLIFLFSFMFFLITSSLFISLLYLLACIYVCLVFFFFTSLCSFTPLSLSSFFFSFFLPFGSFPYRSIKHSFYPLLSDVSPSTSIHLLLTLSLPFPSLSPPDSPPSLHPLPIHHHHHRRHLTRSHSRSLHFSAHEICLTISGSAQGQIREAQPRKPQPLFLSSLFFFSSSLSSQLSNYLCST